MKFLLFNLAAVDLEVFPFSNNNNFDSISAMKIAICVLLLVGLAASVPCNKGGLLCAEGQCHYPAYVEGCLTYGTDDACAQCEYNYVLRNGACLYSPNNNGQDCCLRFDDSSRCVECAKGLILSESSGLCEDFKIVGCLQKDQKGCVICAANYDLVGKICVKSVSGCTAYDQQLNCIACANTTTLYQGACVALTSQITPPNCKTVNQYGCAECLPGFRLDASNNCQATTVVGCIKFNTDGDCLLCYSPFFQLVSGKCAIVGCLQTEEGICKSCDTSLGFQLTNGRCEIANCIYFSEKGCQLCRNGLAAGSWGCKQAVEKVCLICKVDEFLGSDGKCYKKDVHCIQYKGGYCQRCCDTYFLDSSAVCKPKLPGCVYLNSTCTSCVAPFRYDASSSVCLIVGCLDYDYQGCVKCDSRLILNNRECGLPNCEEIKDFTCSKCLSGFNLDSTGQCVPADPNCSVKNVLNQCLKCKEGYQLGNDGRCIVLKIGCNYVDGRCTSCRAPFLYNPEKECCEIDGCESYFLGGCSKCETGYTLLYNTCKLPNCLISKKGKCLQCDPDFVFRSDGTCVSKDEFCDKMDEFGTCIKCMESYFYSQKEKKCVRKSPGCRYDDQDNCIACEAPFTAQPGRCIIPGCLIMQQEGCVQCEYPYQLSKDKTCRIAHCKDYQNGRCVACLEGFALSKKNLCEVADENCIEYNTDRTACTKCRKGYRLDENGRCEYADAHCWDFDAYGICTNCDRLYFLNSYGKCQLRDPQCVTYVNGFCTNCKPYYFVKGGQCFANLKGCKVQKSYNQCETCDKGYNLKGGYCTVALTQLSWNSIDMDFFDGKDEKEQEDSRNTFTVGINTNLNLIQAITSGASVFYSSSSLNNAAYQVDSAGNVGWAPTSKSQSCNGEFIGVKVKTLQTFYAVDIKYLAGSSLKRFSIEYSMDGINYISVGKFSLEGAQLGVAKTFYFKAVHAISIRLVVEEGIPHIKFDFYYSDTTALNKVENKTQSTFISKTVSESIEGVLGGVSTCGDNGLCWAGVEACEPRKIKGFSLDYTCDPKTDFVSEVKIDYSMDGISFTCWNSCQSVALVNGGFVFQEPVLAEKMHIHFSKYSGKPKFGIHFEWA